jgi:putative hemolysin
MTPVRTATYPASPSSIPAGTLDAGRYQLTFARNADELDDVLRLRFNVFNLELGEGLDEAYITSRDEDRFDALFHHLVIRSRESGEVVGTYRMQTAAMASQHGFYSADEFDLGAIPDGVMARSIEVGRACVAREHRNGRVLHLLWRGLATYLAWNRCSGLFGCCSLTSQDPMLGLSVMQRLEREGHIDPVVRVVPLPGTECEPVPGAALPDPHIPALFQSYLTLGAKVWGPPSIDRLFKTIDFLVGLDTETLTPAVYRSFFR